MAALLATQAETTQCFKVKEVIGVSLCMEQMSAAERRVGRERADEEIRCQVRGKFGSETQMRTPTACCQTPGGSSYPS